MNDKFLIRLMTVEKGKIYPTMIKAFYHKHITELLKLYLTAKEYKIPIFIPIEVEGASKFDGKEVYVQDIHLHFGGEEAITCLDIYVEV